MNIIVEFLIVAAVAVLGWFVFLFFARLFTMGNPFQKSEDMETDANTDWYHETRNNPIPPGNPHKMPHDSQEQQDAVRALKEYKKRRDAIDAKAKRRSLAAGKEKTREEGRAMGCGCLLAPVVLAVVVFGILFSSKYPGWGDLINLFGW